MAEGIKIHELTPGNGSVTLVANDRFVFDHNSSGDLWETKQVSYQKLIQEISTEIGNNIIIDGGPPSGGSQPPQEGDLYFDYIDNSLYVYVCSPPGSGTNCGWELVTGDGISSGIIINVGPPSVDNNGDPIKNGDVWWDPDSKELYIRFNGQWQILNPPPVITGSNPPTTNNGGGPVREGDQWFDIDNNLLYIYHNGAWEPVNATGGGIIVGPTPPCQDNDGNPISEGDLWYDNVNNNILIFICDDPTECSDLNCWKAILDVDGVPVTGIKDGDAINVQPKGTGDEASGVVTVNVRYDEDRGLDVDGTSNELFVVLEADGGLGFGPDGGIGIDLNNTGGGLGQLGENEIIIGQPGGGIGVGNLGDLLLGGDGIELEINNNIITINADIGDGLVINNGEIEVDENWLDGKVNEFAGDGEINFEPGDALSAVGDNATANQHDDTTKTFNVNVTEDDLYPGIFIDGNNSLDVAVHEAPQDDMVYLRFNGEWVGWDELIAACDNNTGEPVYLVGDGGVDKIFGDGGSIDGDALLYESALDDNINNLGLITEIDAGSGIQITGGCSPTISLIDGTSDGEILVWNDTTKEWELGDLGDVEIPTVTAGKGIATSKDANGETVVDVDLSNVSGLEFTSDDAFGQLQISYDGDRGLDIDVRTNELYAKLGPNGGLEFEPDGSIGVDENWLDGKVNEFAGDGEINFEPGDALSAVGDNATANQDTDTTKTFNVNVTEDDLYPGIFIDNHNSLDVAVHEAPQDNMVYLRFNGEWIGWDELIASCDNDTGEPVYLVGDGGVDKIFGDGGTIDGDALLYESALDDNINNLGLITEIDAGSGIQVTSGCSPTISLIDGTSDGEILVWNDTTKEWELGDQTDIEFPDVSAGKGIITYKDANDDTIVDVDLSDASGLEFTANDASGQLQVNTGDALSIDPTDGDLNVNVTEDDLYPGIFIDNHNSLDVAVHEAPQDDMVYLRFNGEWVGWDELVAACDNDTGEPVYLVGDGGVDKIFGDGGSIDGDALLYESALDDNINNLGLITEIDAGSGIEVTGGCSPTISLIDGTSDGEILVWNDTTKEWELGDQSDIEFPDVSAGKGIITSKDPYGDTIVDVDLSDASGLEFTANDASGQLQINTGDALSIDSTDGDLNVNVTTDPLYPGIFIDAGNSLDVAVHEAPQDNMVYLRFNGEWVGWDELVSACDNDTGEPVYLVGDGGVDKIFGDGGSIDGDALLYESALDDNINNLGLITEIDAGSGIQVTSGCSPTISLIDGTSDGEILVWNDITKEWELGDQTDIEFPDVSAGKGIITYKDANDDTIVDVDLSDASGLEFTANDASGQLQVNTGDALSIDPTDGDLNVNVTTDPLYPGIFIDGDNSLDVAVHEAPEDNMLYMRFNGRWVGWDEVVAACDNEDVADLDNSYIVGDGTHSNTNDIDRLLGDGGTVDGDSILFDTSVGNYVSSIGIVTGIEAGDGIDVSSGCAPEISLSTSNFVFDAQGRITGIVMYDAGADANVTVSVNNGAIQIS